LDAKWHASYSSVGPFTPDVGVLKVDLPFGQTVPTVAQLAPEEDLRELSSGSPLCYIGFPGYDGTDYLSKLSKVNARTYQGRLNRLMTLSEEQGEYATQQLVEHDMWSWPGSSGSPIFNKRGKVVALHFAGDFVNRAKAVASPKYGMRADLLKEVLATFGPLPGR
jgi:hypothetical protein